MADNGKQLYHDERMGIVDTWVKNMLPSTSLEIIGHIMLGAVLQDQTLNAPENYVDADACKVPEELTFDAVATYETRLSSLLGAEEFQVAVGRLRQQYRDSLHSGTPVVAGSLRALAEMDPSATFPRSIKIRFVCLRKRT